MEINVQLVRDNQGQAMHIQSVVRDIRERKQAERALQAKREDEQRFQTYLTSLQEIVIELSRVRPLDAFYRQAVELGRKHFAFERLGLLLYEAPFALGTYGTDCQGQIIAEWEYRFGPGDLPSILLRAIQHEERFIFDEDAELFDHFESIGRGQNAVAVLWNGTDQLGWLAIDNALSHEPISQAQLEILALYALSLGNLLAQKQIQMSLEASEARYRSVVGALKEGILILDAEGIIRACNPAAESIMGLKAAEILGQRSFDLWSQASHEDGSAFAVEDDPATRSLKTGQGYQELILALPSISGDLLWLSVNSQPLVHPHETEAYGAVLSLVDISERKKSERQTLELQLEQERMRVLSAFIEGSSHEFRTPLAIIKTSLYVLSKSADSERRQAKIKTIEEQIVRIANLVDKLTLLSRLDSGEEFSFRLQDLNILLRGIASEIQPQYSEKGLVLVVDLAENLPKTKVDPSQILRAIRELLDNALHFSPAGASVKLATQFDETHITIPVTDTGPGISQESLAHIFERFYRQDTAHSTPGFGLGLAIAQSIVLRHSGIILVESRLEEGSSFQIILPISY